MVAFEASSRKKREAILYYMVYQAIPLKEA